MSQQAEELVSFGQLLNLMSMTILKSASTTTAGTQMGILVESGAIQWVLYNGSIALFLNVFQSH